MDLRTSPLGKLPKYQTMVITVWTIFILALIGLQVALENSQVMELARTEARVSINQDLVYRQWNADSGGVYVPVADETQPNPYLDLPEREVVTSSGRLLTLMNPAYMTRLVNELKAERYGIYAHLTSLDPINPENKGDAWEKTALQAFEKGSREVSSLEIIDGVEYMRLMMPFMTEESCLKCHKSQGYQVGDIRGGLSVSVPLSRYSQIKASSILAIMLGYGMVWLLGVVGTVLVSRDLRNRLEEREQMMVAVQESHAEYRTMIQTTNDGFCALDRSGKIIDVNDAYCKMSGYERQELLQKKFEDMEANQSSGEIEARLGKVIQEGRDRFETVQRKKDGSIFDVEISAQFLKAGKGKIFLFLRDITVQKLSSRKMSSLLQEKEILLAEVHHRVKNNMQVIASLLSLQAQEIGDEHLQIVYDESRNRINSMALVHEQLYRSKEYARIDIGTYIDQLATSLFNSFQVDPNRICLQISAENVSIDLERAIPCGLILNELLTNSLKYAFPGGRAGVIKIHFERNGTHMHLLFGDDGAGLPVNFELENAKSLGLQLVRLLTYHDLQGSLEVGTGKDNGTRFSIRFPLAGTRCEGSDAC